MRTYDECCEAVRDQLTWWYKIGKISIYDRDSVDEAIDITLTEDEQDMCYDTNPHYMYESILELV